jgi:hypothetical protein
LLGWSLGGYLSLSLARFFADDPSLGITVLGQLIVDSPRHIPRSQLRGSTVEPELAGLPDLVRKSFDNCDAMLEHWQLPAWDAPTRGGTPISVATGGAAYTIRPGTVLRRPVGGSWAPHAVKRHDFEGTPAAPKAPPPAVMVRCTLPAQRAKAAQGSRDPCTIDLFRDEPLLGWEAAYPDFIVATIDVEADHYSVLTSLTTTRFKPLRIIWSRAWRFWTA